MLDAWPNRRTARFLFLWIAVFLAQASSPAPAAGEQVYQREYDYLAGEADSKITSRTIALEQVKRLLLEELGTYLESETVVKDFQVARDQVVALAAGVVRTEILSERWDGTRYTIVAKITVDPDEVVRSLDRLRRDRESVRELEAAAKRTDELLAEIDSLKRELAASRAVSPAANSRKYELAVATLGAAESYRTGRSLANSKQFAEAIPFFDKTIEADPDNADAWSNRAYSYIRTGNPDQAIRDCTRALELAPGHAGALTNRAIAHMARRDFWNARLDLEWAVQTSPGYARVYALRAIVRLAENDPRGAHEDGRKAVELAPGYLGGYLWRGVANRVLKEYDAAFADFGKAIGIDPDWHETYYHRGKAYFELKQ